MLNKYENLKSMLSKEYSVSLFDDISIAEEYALIGTNLYSISIFVEEDKLQVVIERKDEDEDRWEEVETRYYKTAKPAYKFIKDWMQTINTIESQY